MTTKKILKFLTLAAGLFVGSAAVAGDIFEIRPCTAIGEAVPAYATIDNPMTSGEDVYFNVRLLRSEYGENSIWYLDHTNIGSEEVDWAINPLQIGIYVSGELRYADLVSCAPHKTAGGVYDGFTDFIFAYKTRPGDFALPIVLALNDKTPASDSDTGFEYLINYRGEFGTANGVWRVTNRNGETAVFSFKAPGTILPGTFSPDGDRVTDYSLSKCGFYVKTIDFDPEWEIPQTEPNKLWRSVHQNSSITVGLTPKLVAAAAPEDKVTLHVWSTSTNCVEIKGGRTVDLVTGYNGTEPIVVPTQVGDITFSGGQMTADFQIQGVGLSNTCNLVLSAWDHYNYVKTTGKQIIDYITVPVKSIEPMPPTVVVEVDRKDAVANGNYLTYGALLSVYLTQAYDEPVTVKVTPSFSDGSDGDWGEYVRFSTTQDEVQNLPDGGAGNEITVTIPAGSTAKQQIYVFCLRGDTHTTGTSRLVFTPSLVDPDEAMTEAIKYFTSASLEVKAGVPEILTPSEGATIVGVCGDEIDFTLAVSDTYADLSDAETGYKIFVKYRPQDAYKQLDGLYYAGEGGVLYVLEKTPDGAGGWNYNKTTELPTLNYPGSGEGLQSQVYVVAPVSGKKSEIRNFLADIKEARTSEVLTYDAESGEEKKTFNEGDEVTFRIRISEKNDTGDTIYAFLQPSSNADPLMFSAETPFVIGMENPEGLPINKYQDMTDGTLMILDGKGKKSGGLKLTFEVVLSSDKNDPTQKIPGYDSNYHNVTVYNVEPMIRRIEMNGVESETDGFTFTGKVPKGMEKTFVAVVDDAGAYDLINTEKPFQCKWTISLAGVGVIETKTIEGDPAENPLKYSFPRAGTWTIKLQVKDKDMTDWAEVNYSVNVLVLDNPVAEVIATDEFLEDGTTNKIQVQLSYWDTLYSGNKLKVKVTVTPYDETKANPGLLELDSHLRSTEPGEENVYYVEIGDDLPVDLLIEAMDGTDASSTYGFIVTAEVVTDAELPTSHNKANEYYLIGSKKIRIANVAPVCFVNPQENTNRWSVSGEATSHPINWSVRSDVDADFEGIEGFEGVKVTFIGCDNATEFFVTESTSGKFVPSFGSAQGDVDLTLIIEDKDGGLQSWTWQYTVTPSKLLETLANGPSDGTSTSPLSRKYAKADGRGAGHTYVTGGATAMEAENFKIRWNCGTMSEASVYGFGYKIGNVDDGSLLPYDQAIGSDGTRDGEPFKYDDWLAANGLTGDENQKDSFFYCWIQQPTERGSSDSILGGTISPERPGATAIGKVLLPTDKTGEGGYLVTFIEAVFSLEWRPGDNLGDINQDGVPDYYALKDDWANGKLIQFVHGQDDLSGDLLALNDSNSDEDYLPGVYENEDIQALVSDSKNSWAPIGPAFQTLMELRGFGEGLNEPDGKVTRSDVDLSDDEKKARENWFNFQKAAGGLADYDSADALPLTVWSPEPGQYSDKYKHMDPTTPDTDGDNLTDGWEYYIWYQAHVTYWTDAKYYNLAAENHENLFESFSLASTVKGDWIDPATVEELFNPLKPRTKEQIKKVPDTDKDGLSDYEEYLIGTNPCKWDTDGDRMADGWEVMMSLNPLDGNDRGGNPDGDFFALFKTMDMYARAPNGGQGGFATKPGEEYQIDLSGQYFGFNGKGIYWDENTPAEYDEDGNLVAFPTAIALKDFTAPLFCFTSFADPIDPTQAYRYGVAGDMPKDPFENRQAYWGYFMSKEFEIREVEVHAGDVLVMPLFVFIHDQVRSIFGFDPRTGWYKTGNGYVADRWDPTVNTDLLGVDVTGLAVNTEPFYTYDEYLVARFRTDFHKMYPIPPSAKFPMYDADNMWASFRSLATNPNVPKRDVTTGEEVENIVIDPETGATNVVKEIVTKTETVDTPAGTIAAAIAAALTEAGDKEPTLRHGADTDGDGVPDGWELYTYRDPCLAYGAEENVMMPCLGLGLAGDLEDDGLTYAMEFAGTDSCNAYKDCETIYRNHPGNRSGWFNKFFPTNPSFQAGDFSGFDTDEDGIVDSVEGGGWVGVFYNGGDSYVSDPDKPGFSFVYGEPVDDGSACIRGGGLNPLSCDTDLDGLPDPWEMQYAGVIVNAATKAYAGRGKFTPEPDLLDTTWIADGILNGGPDVVYIAGGMDGTWGGDGYTDPTLNTADERNSTDNRLGTVRDVDFDHDGLQNWQEYLVQQVRHFRYDDITTPLMGRQLKEGRYNGLALVSPHTQQFLGFTPMLQDASMFAINAAETWYGSEVLEPTTVTNQMVVTKNAFTDLMITNYLTTVVTNIGTGATVVREHMDIANAGMFQYPWVPQAWELLGYYSMAHNSWDRSIAWSGGQIIRYFMYPAAGGMYVSTDPRMSDTDLDGMDDYYEMFHGLNPILGSTAAGDPSRDIIAYAYGVPTSFNAFWNEWTHPDFNRMVALMGGQPSGYPPLTAPNALDPVMYPWAMGALEADADGDGLRNHEESLLANVTSPTPTHTDPTPLWFTDSSSAKSFVSQYYGLTQPVLQMPFWPLIIGYGDTLYPEAAYKGSLFGYTYAFEENEGYDTDGDWLADQREIIKTTSNATDPLLFADPVRRQAAYFDGVNSFMMTRQLQQRSCDADDFFKQFTVECWVCPELTGRDQTILERSSFYEGNAVTKLGGVIRANFRIGLSSDGRVYGMFDNTDSIESGLNQPMSCQRIDGGVLPLEKWSHVALTFDGKKLVLYVNGEFVNSAETSLIPANGVLWIGQNVGHSGRFPGSEYQMVPTAFFIGARPQHFAGSEMIGFRYVPLFPTYVEAGHHYESFDNYREFFQGYVDEVRLWDGARSEADIHANYLKAMTFAEVSANRDEVYESWMLGYGRNNNYNGGLPPELVQHYTFTALPGAVKAADVAKTPFGFDQGVAASAMSGYTDAGATYGGSSDATEPLYDIKGLGLKGVPGSWDLQDGINVTWWDECLIHSTVYDDTRVIPWVHNTVAHLPVMDGSCLDSFMYADGLGAQYRPAAVNGVESFVFPNTATPYQRMIYDLDWYNRMFCHDVLTNQLGAAYAPYATRYQFEIRDHMLGTSDLLPMGGAYAKTCPEMWDGAVADAWEVTGVDEDGDGLPDWWEEYARANYCDGILDPGDDLNWDTAVLYNGVKTSAWEAYLIDLSRGLQPGTDGNYDETYASTIDADNDSLPDWWENLFGIAKYGALDDPDHDGLSNYAEWRITYGPDPFGVQNGWPILNPNLLHTDPDFDATDYFITVTNEPYAGHYLGEIVTDHDFMEDLLEPALGTDRTVYDPYSDKDEDGWTAWSELRFSKFKASQVSKLVSHIVGNEEIPDSPVPVVHATIRYNGEKLEPSSTTPIVVQAYTGGNLQKKPNAKFVIKPGVSEERYVNLGAWENRVVHGTMTPGFIKAGLDIIKLQQTFVQPDDLYCWEISDQAASAVNIYTGTYAEMRAALTRAEAEGRVFKLNDQTVDWVDVMNETGDKLALQLTIDPKTQCGHFLFMNEQVGDVNLLTGDFTFDMAPIGKWYMAGSHIDLQQGFYRIAYTAQVPTLQAGALSVSLANADTGALKEGMTTFVAFADLDGNGEYDPATEPIGIVRDVAVGWDRVTDVRLEMLDSPSCGYRLTYGEDVTKLRIIRNAINGSTSNVVKTIVFNRATADAASRVVWDGDFSTVGKFGLDWSALRNDLLADGTRSLKDVTSVGYIVVTGDDKLNEIAEESIIDSFTVSYIADAAQSLPVCCSPSPKADGIVTVTRPTFVWSAIDGFTAFRLQIADADGAVVYSSDLAALPARDAAKRYVWTAPVYVGLADSADSWTLANNTNYSWRVAMYNPKFSNTNDAASAWSDWSAFSTAVAEKNDFTTSAGTAQVDVRYYGPATNTLGQVVVALFKTADFTGVPAAQARLADVEGDVSSLADGQTVTFIGLESGEYYAVAYIDRNDNAKRDRYESWGYYNQIGRAVEDIYTPRAVVVNASGSSVPCVKLYIEDTDLNQNKVPDPFDDEELLKEADRETTTGGGGGEDTTDADGDGLSYAEESNTGTDASKFDTDDDGMPDGWEAIFAGTVAVNPDAERVADGDVMAYAETIRTVVTDASGKAYVLQTNVIARVGDEIDPENLFSTYDYPVLTGDATNRVVTTYLGLGTNLVAGSGKILIDTKREATVVLVHAQVYDEFGYDNKTAAPVKGAPHTKPFTALDKYLVARYLQAIGFTGIDEAQMNRNRAWGACTLKPLDADNDRDGMGDGWELYVMFGTNTTAYAAGKALAEAPISPWNFADRETTFDGDALTAVDEYAEGLDPSDPWNEHSVYEALVKAGIIGPEIAPFTDEVRRFGIGEDELDLDWDEDYVSNAGEMWAYYNDYANGSTLLADIDPRNPKSDGVTPDYFRAFVPAAGEIDYLGGAYNGGEFIEPEIRKFVIDPGFNRYGTHDYRYTGWDAWSTARHSLELAEGTANIDGVVSEELMLIVRYLDVIRPGEFEGSTVKDVVEFFHSIFEGIVRILDADGNVVADTKDGSVSAPGTSLVDASAVQTTHDMVRFFGGVDKMQRDIALNKKDLTSEDIVIPEAPINVILKYAGNGSYNVFVEAYQVNPAYPEYGEQKTAKWSIATKFDSGVAISGELNTPTMGSLKQGPARFIAYIDVDQDNKLSAADVYGETERIVGYKGGTIVIRLGEANAAFPIVSLTDETVAEGTGDEGGEGESGEIRGTSAAVDDGETYSTVAFVRSAVNGVPLYNNAKGVFIAQFPNNAAREIMTPAEYDSGNYIGIDQTLRLMEGIDEVESVTYEILRLRADQVATLSVTNLNNYIIVTNATIAGDAGTENVLSTNIVSRDVNETVTFHYSLERDVASAIAWAGSTEDDWTMTFTVPTDTVNTKFWLEINGTLYGGNKGFLLVHAADGRVVLDKGWFEANGVSVPTGVVRFGVTLGNDKFGKPDSPAGIVAECVVNEGAEFDGKLLVTVKHPTAELDAKLTVAVYEKQDLAQPYRIYTEQAADEVLTLEGLREGVGYFVAAWYVKDPADGRVKPEQRMPYDTWGYVTQIGVSANGFDAKGVTATMRPMETNIVYLQDTDWNDNDILDREEDFKGINGTYPCAATAIYGFDIEGVEEAELYSDAQESDVFAYAEVPFYCIQALEDGVQTWYAVTDLAAETVSDKVTPGIPRGTLLRDLKTLKAVYFYDYGGSNPKRLGLGTNVTVAADSEAKVVEVMPARPLILVHAQVYDHFGFNSATANGALAPELWVNTKSFTSVDKAYVTNYLANVCGWTDLSGATLPIDYVDADETVDGRGDGIPDGWELYVMYGPDGIDAGTVTHSPWNFDDRFTDADGDDLDLLHEYDGGFAPTDPWDADTNGDGITDGIAWKYHIKNAAGMLADQDGDGLCNYVEYLLSEVFDLGVDFDPDDAYSVNDNELDYFFRIGSLYAGEIFTDFDMVEDDWEVAAGEKTANPYAWDALADYDEKGWSNFDRRRVEDYPTLTTNAAGEAVMVTGLPQPTLKVTFTYGGKQSLGSASPAGETGVESEATGSSLVPIVLKTYTRSDLLVADGTYSVVPAESLSLGRQTLAYTAPVDGRVKCGDNVFVAFADLDGNGVYSVGEPMGMATDVKVGFSGAETAIELTDVSPIITRMDLSSGETDRHVLYGTEDGDNRNLIPGTLSGGTHQRVRIIRTLVNGYGVDKIGVANRILFDETIELGQRPYLFEGDILKLGEFDLDWSYLDDDLQKTTSIYAADPTEVTYRIVLGNGTVAADTTNNLFEVATVRHFDANGNRQRPVPIAPGLENAVVYGSRPTFKWTMDGHNSYTAFRISVSKAGGGEVWNSGFVRTPPCSSEGVYSYTPGIYVGDQLQNDQNYTWKVSMYNSKFKRDFYSSKTMTFRMNAPTDGGYYGKIPVCVKYFGPAEAINGSTVYVEAFATPDFTGDPLARCKATDKAKVTQYGVVHEANVDLLGLTKGTYYIRAYLDSTGYGTRYAHDDWESWGYLCGRERDLKSPFKPLQVRLTDATDKAELVTVYIEDADTNGNKLPDSYEMAKYGTLDRGAADLNGSTYGGVALNSTLTSNLASKAGPGATGGLVTELPRVLSSPAYAAMALAVAPEEMVVEEGMIVAEPGVEDGSLVITSFRLENGEVVMDVAAETKLETGVGASFYELKVRAGATVTAKIFRADPADGEWTLAAEQQIVISGEGTSLRTPVSGLSVTGELYRVEIVK